MNIFYTAKHEHAHMTAAAIYAYQKRLPMKAIQFLIHANDNEGEFAIKSSDDIRRDLLRVSASAPVATLPFDEFKKAALPLDFRLASHELSDDDIIKASVANLNPDQHHLLLLATRHYLKSMTTKKRVGLMTKLRELNDFMPLADVLDPVSAEASIKWANDNLRDFQLGKTLKEPVTI